MDRIRSCWNILSSPPYKYIIYNTMNHCVQSKVQAVVSIVLTIPDMVGKGKGVGGF